MASWADQQGGAAGSGRPAGVRTDPERAPSGVLLVEVAWEVCNQLGGIYQVIRSKAPRMVGRWKDRYLMLGPYNPAKAHLEFEESTPRAGSWLARSLEQLRQGGLVVRHGHWLIQGRPRVLLVEHGPPHMPADELDGLKFRLWSEHGIETPPGDALINGVVSFGEASKRVLWSLALNWAAGDDEHADPAGGAANGTEPGPKGGRGAHRRTLAHFHEWMAGVSIPLLRKEGAPVSIVFTTHATQLGRTLAWGDEWFYDHLPFVDEAREAARVNLRTQHGIERACAHGSHVFTTVSPITGEECTHLLGRSPDLVLPNGLNIEHYNVGHDFQTFHAQFKERIHRFTMGHFFPSYSFDLDKTLYFFTSGRFEPRNKGFDLCIEAMARLNAEMKAARLDRTVVLFIITQRPTRSLHPRALHGRGVLNELDEVSEKVVGAIRERWFRRLASGGRMGPAPAAGDAGGGGGGGGGGGDAVVLDDLISEYWRLRIRRTQHALKTDHLPLVVTHLLEDDQKDEVLNQIRKVWLFNRADDPVKIVYHPEFIAPTNPLWGIEYDQFVRGCHLGVFPSAYEPWGYTPLEAIAMGVPAVTSDLAGFGRYVEQTIPDLATGLGTPGEARREGGGAGGERSGGGGGAEARAGSGVLVLKRRGRTFNEAAADLSRQLLDFCKLDRRQRIQLRNEVERRSWEFDWGSLGQAYDWAHDLALVKSSVSV